MGVIQKQGAQASIIAYIGVLVGFVNTLWLMPNFLTSEEIGLISTLISFSLMIIPFTQLGVNGIILKFYPFFKDSKEQESSFIYFITLIPLLGFFATMLLLLLSKNFIIERYQSDSPLFIDYMFYIVPITLFMSLRNIMETLMRASYLISIPKLFKEVGIRVFLGLLIVIYATQNLDLHFLIGGYTLLFFLNAVALYFYIRKVKSFSIRARLKPLDTNLIKKASKYGAYIILNGFTGMLVTKIDTVMVYDQLGLASTGIYTISMYIALAIEMPKRSLNQISMPVIGQAIKDKNIKKINRLYAKSSLIQLIIGSILLINVWINIDDLFQFIPNSEQYITGKYVVLFIGLAVLIDMATGFNNEIIMMSDFYKWNIVLMGFLISLAVFLNLLLIPVFGITGVAMASTLTMLLFNTAKYIIVQYKLHIQPFRVETIYSILISTATIIIGYILPSTEYYLINILYKSSLLSSFFIILHLKLRISPDLEDLIQNIFKEIRKKL